VSFLNATATTVTAINLFAPHEKEFPVFRARDIRPGAATRFHSIVPGDYRLQALFSARSSVKAAPVESIVHCGDAAYWLICCFMRDNRPVFEQRLLGIGEGIRRWPGP
jgi:hypothetical protein